MLVRYGAAFAICSLMHVFGGIVRNAGAEKRKGSDFKTKGDLLHAIKGRRKGTENVSSSEADEGTDAKASSDDEDETGRSKRRDKNFKRLPVSSSSLPSSLMSALALPPPSPLSMTSEEFIRDFLSKYPPAPKSYEVTTA
jgi:hypothetical protein